MPLFICSLKVLSRCDSLREPHNGPLQIGDWLLLIEPIISDLSITAGEWWTGMVTAADHMAMNPREKIQHRLEVPTVLTADKWMRLERRTASMLLQAVPAPKRDELVSSRRMSSFGILTHLLATYSPGGVSEKQTLLRNLEDSADISSIADAPNQLRRWLRWRRRATEIGAVPPDPTLQLKGLNKMTRKILDGNQKLQFRISLVRSTLGVDTTPSDINIEQLAHHILAEVEQLALMDKKASAPTGKDPPKLKSMDVDKSDKGKGKGKDKEKFTWRQPALGPRAAAPMTRAQPRPRF